MYSSQSFDLLVDSPSSSFLLLLVIVQHATSPITRIASHDLHRRRWLRCESSSYYVCKSRFLLFLSTKQISDLRYPQSRSSNVQISSPSSELPLLVSSVTCTLESSTELPSPVRFSLSLPLIDQSTDEVPYNQQPWLLVYSSSFPEVLPPQED